MTLLSAAILQMSFIALTLTTGVLGGAALLFLYRTQPKARAYGLQLLTIAAAFAARAPLLALIVVCINILIIFYLRMERKPLYKRTIFAVIFSASVYFLALFCWAHFYLREDFWTWIAKELDIYVKQSQHVFSGMHIDPKLIVRQLPSFVVTIFALNMWLAVIFDSKAQKKIGILRTEREIKNFKAPELFIWVAIMALLFSFVKTPIPWLQEAALNVLNVSLLVYFFQGLSVVSFIMEMISAGIFVKIIIYFIFIAQLLLPICLGILDFWLNFRNKISKRKQSLH